MKKKWLFLASFDPQNIFMWVLPLLDVRHCCKLSSYPISRKINEPKLRKWPKNLVLGLILAPSAHIWAQKLFFVNFTFTRSYTLLQAIIVYELNEKLMNQTSENRRKLYVLGLILTHFAKFWTVNFFFFFFKNLAPSVNIMVSYHHTQYQKN